MTFTHGMNIEEVRTQATELGSVREDTGTSRGDANDTIHDFVESDWWGDDANTYLETWMSTVDPAYEAVCNKLDEIKENVDNQANMQEETSAS